MRRLAGTAALVASVVSCAPAVEERHAVVPKQPAPAASSSAAATPPGNPIVHRLSAARWNTCLVRNDGAVVCWGPGAIAAVPQGLGGLTTPLRPVTIAGTSDATEVATLTHAGCALGKTGSVACWGSGTLPDGTALDRTKAATVPGITATKISVFGREVCGLSGNELACFAFDGKPSTRKKLPVPGADVIDLSGNDGHGCLVTRSGAVHCRGSNSLGAVGGNGGDGFVQVPKIADAISVAAADNFTCVAHASGHRSCWGNGHDLPGGWGDGKYPVVTDTTRTDYVRVSADRTACWILRDQQVRCDGRGEHGQLGTGAASAYSRANVKGLTDAIDVAAGFEHACALRANGEVVCWGANDYAQLGDGTLTDRTVPTAVLGLGGKEPPPPQKPGSGPPLALATTAAQVPAWREVDGAYPMRLDGYGFSRFGKSPSSFGTKAALFQSEGLALHAEHGLVGPIAFPAEAKVVALDGDDAVWVGTKGALSRAADVLDAKKGKFQKVLALPFAVDFAVTAGMVVAADARTLHVTKNGGQSFTKVTPKVDVTIEQVFARADGLLAIEGNDKAGESVLLLAKDGTTFVPSKFRPTRLMQSGAYLFGHGCPGAILSSDGITWNRWEHDYGTPVDGSPWGAALQPSSYPRAFDVSKYPTLASPAAPEPAKEGITGTPGKCGGGGSGIGFGGGGRGRRRGGACIGASCIRASIGDEPRATSTQVAFYGDGVCERDAKGACKPKWKREPHVWLNSSKGPIELPTGCSAIRLLSAGGIGVLFCEKDTQTSNVYTIAKDGVFQAEGTVPAFAIDAVTIATDGTLVVHPVCGEKGQGESGLCPGALVRSPSALGAANAWRQTQKGFAYRVLPGGAVLVIGGDTSTVTFSIDRAGKSQSWGPSVVLVADLVDVEVLKDRVVLVQQMTTRKEKRAYLAADGLVPQE